MTADDLTALAAISMGAVATVAATLALTTGTAEATLASPAVVEAPATCPATRSIVDFAIVRSGGDRSAVQIMVGPEGEHSGWDAESRTLRLRARGR